MPPQEANNTEANDDGSSSTNGSNDKATMNKFQRRNKINGAKKQWITFKGSEPKMNGHVFQCPEEVRYQKPNQFNRTVEELRTHADKELQNSYDVCSELHEFEKAKIEAPSKLTRE